MRSRIAQRTRGRPEELEELLRLEVPLAQGYLFGRPSPGWSVHLPDAVGALIQTMNDRLAAPDHVGALMEPAMTVRETEGAGAADTVVVLDHRDRPCAIHTLHGHAGPTELLVVKPEER